MILGFEDLGRSIHLVKNGDRYSGKLLTIGFSFRKGKKRVSYSLLDSNKKVIFVEYDYNVTSNKECKMCDGTGYKDYAGYCMDPCNHNE